MSLVRHTYTYMHIYIHIDMHVYIYINIYACIYIYTYIIYTYTCIIVSRIIMQATHPDEFQAVSVRLLGVRAT